MMALAERVETRLKRQRSNSGGFQRDVSPDLLDHTTNHPHLVVAYGRAAETIAIANQGRGCRQRHIYTRYQPLMTRGVLDVGCDVAELRNLVKEGYVGLDLYGKPDVAFDLSSGQPLPFDDRSFSFVACTDVLEHLEQMHFYCAELFRVAADYVMIGLPNCWYALWKSLKVGRPVNKNYGLPPERPGDRHHWVFTAEESWDFVLYQAAKAGFTCLESVHFTIDIDWSVRDAKSAGARLLQGLAGRLLRWSIPSSPRFDSDWDWLNRHTIATWWLLQRSHSK